MFHNKRYCNFVKQSKAIIIFLFILFIFNSCSDELITIVDEYNPPYEVKAIPGSNSISINFWSGVLANDFAGFNLYANTTGSFTQDDAISNLTAPLYPTVPFETHTRSNITLTLSNMNGTPQGGYYTNGVLYYVGVTAYGTNDLAEGGKIETTKVNAIPVVPREVTTVTSSLNNGANIGGITISIDTAQNTISATVGGTTMQVKSYGYRTEFNEITVFTNDSPSTSAPYSANSGWLYIFYSSGTSPTLTKLWITSGGYTWASHSVAGCNTI